MKIRALYLSEDHNFFGHHNQPPGEAPMIEVDSIEVVKGKGIRGDRFFDYKPDYKGQVTFFAHETYLALQEKFGVFDRDPSVFRRNILTEGIDLNTLIGETFEVQGVSFEGIEEARPCYWMEQAFCEGAEEALKGFGGLRAKVLSDGVIRVERRYDTA